MDPGENSAQCGFLVRSRKPRERALYSRHNFGRNREVETISAEKRNQHLCSARADNRVRPWIGRVWRGIANLGKPVGIVRGIGIVICRRSTYSRNWSPKPVCVFCVVESNHVVG